MSTDQTSPQNIDLACARTGRELAHIKGKPKEIENILTKALGVLEEQGVYAMFLYLFARENRTGVDHLAQLLRDVSGANVPAEIAATLAKLDEQLEQARREQRQKKKERNRTTKRQSPAASPNPDSLKEKLTQTENDFFERLAGLANELDGLLFTRELLHKALVYGRYHAKARQCGGGDG